MQFSGMLGIGLCFAWSLVVKDVPTRVKHITDAELIYITGSAHGRGKKRVTPVVSAVFIQNLNLWN